MTLPRIVNLALSRMKKKKVGIYKIGIKPIRKIIELVNI